MPETIKPVSSDETHGKDIAVTKAVYSLKDFSPLIVVVEKNSPELLIPPFKTTENKTKEKKYPKRLRTKKNSSALLRFPKTKINTNFNKNKDKTPDKKHFSPLTVVVEKNSPELLMFPVKIEVNAHFHDEKHKIPETARNNVFSDYYLKNTNKHFVWTNRNVAKKDTKIDTTPKKVLKNRVSKYKTCSVENPETRFELRVKDKFGFGLYAKHDIPKGLFSLIFISYL